MKNQLKKISGVLIILAAFLLLIIPQSQLFAIQPSAKLKIAHNDGVQCYLNSREFVNTLTEPQTERYWNKEIDVSNYLQSGQNLLACRISNGDGNPGGGSGYFDVELIANSQTIIQKGSSSWKYFGTGGSITPPPTDSNSRQWYVSNYNDGSWSIGSTPFDGKTGSVLKKSPDDAWFRKSFNLDNSLFGLSTPPYRNCPSFTNQIDCLNQGCYWLNSACQENQQGFWDENAYRIRNLSRTGCWTPTLHRLDRYINFPQTLREFIFDSPKPLITGLVKYGNQIEVYVDGASIGRAVVKEGEYSGVANFHFKPKENIVAPSDYLTPHTLKIVATNLYDQNVCGTEAMTFIVTPYPAPVVHRLGEIPYLPRADRLVIKTKKPLITGLVKYGSVVDIFIDDKFVGRAKVKEGEKSGWANFYLTLKNPLSIGEHTLYTLAKKAGQEDLVSAPSQVFNFSVEE